MHPTLPHRPTPPRPGTLPSLSRGLVLALALTMGSHPLAAQRPLAAHGAAPTRTPAPTTPHPGARPNFVFILIDDAGFSDLGAYGSEIQTPNIDRIAQEGVRFTNFHTASTCESSRATLHTGIDHHRAGAGTLRVVAADNQQGQPGYEGYLNARAHSLGRLLRDGGYATYFVGKWNLGDGLEHAPGAKGWDRYLALEQTGADNYEAKVYAPLNLEAVWWQDGQRAQLPRDFFSTRHYVDTLIRYIDEGPQERPFFGVVALQAVHSPLQAPASDIARYAQTYREGWEAVRAQRYQRQVASGLVPAQLALPQVPGGRAWNTLSATEQALYARKMAVFAAMLDNADQHVGRLREHLRAKGLLDNTVFIVMSDNGADAFELNTLNLPFRLWYASRFALGHDTAGLPGSYVHYGPDWAQVSNTPLYNFKGTSSEGGMRVPFIISSPGRIRSGAISHSYAHATDFLPTVLELAGIPVPGERYRGQALMRPTGTSMLPHLTGRATQIHPAGYGVGFEGTGADYWYSDGYKISRNKPPAGDGQWHLYHVEQDITESHDLAAQEPGRLARMRAQYDTYLRDNGVIPPPADYDPLRQLLKNNWRVLLQQMLPLVLGVLASAALALGAGLWALRRWRRRA